MQDSAVESGLNVKITRLGSTLGMTIAERHLSVRKVGITGTVLNFVPGHGGDVWFVQHDKSEDIGAYVFNEFEAA